MTRFTKQQWAVVLGGSSGFGLASAKKLAAEGMSVFVVHRDRRGAMDRIEREFDEIRAHGNGFVSLNLDALTPEGMAAVLDALASNLGADGRVRVLLHSIAFGNLKLLVHEPPADAPPALERLAEALGVPAAEMDTAVDALAESGEPIFQALRPVYYGEGVLDDEDMARTIFSMGTSLMTWVQRIHAAGLFAARRARPRPDERRQRRRVARLRGGGGGQGGARVGVARHRGGVRPLRHPLEHHPARRDRHAGASRHPRQRPHEGGRRAAATRSAGSRRRRTWPTSSTCSASTKRGGSTAP